MSRDDHNKDSDEAQDSRRSGVRVQPRILDASAYTERDVPVDAAAAAHASIVHDVSFLISEELGEEIEAADPYDPALGYAVERRVRELLTERETVPLSVRERDLIAEYVVDDLLGLGPLQTPLDDPTVTEIMVNGPDQVLVRRSGAFAPADRVFSDSDHLEQTAHKLLAMVGEVADASTPIVEARMPDGSRINIVMPPLAVEGPVLTISKFAHDAFSAEDLLAFGTLDERLADFLETCVRGRLNILVSGATGSGRTTLLNVLGSWIPDGERVVTIEDGSELRLPQHQVIRLETRPANIDGRGGVGLRELLCTSLRMHADRIVVGEVKGSEAFEMLMSVGAGQDGWMTTIHAGSPADALARFEMLASLGAGSQTSAQAIRAQVSAGIDLVVHLVRLRDGTRRIMHVAEVGDPTEDGVAVRDLFRFDTSSGFDSTGRMRGRTVPTGLMPVFSDKLAELGVSPEQLGLDLRTS